ncbi:hypothetical protein ABIC94_002172 [Variovorax paradoxus]|jgi:hypothetical protein|uniref:Dabb family protein n=1 Tax=Variovorax paradoxus TaxID=34073 RepID=UPI0033918110
MIRHIVMWDVSGTTVEEKQGNIERLRSCFHGLRGRVPGLLHLEVGKDASGVDYACDVVLYSEFESWEALAAYAVHPEHLRARDALAGVRIARHQVDYAIQAGRAWAERDTAEIA